MEDGVKGDSSPRGETESGRSPQTRHRDPGCFADFAVSLFNICQQKPPPRPYTRLRLKGMSRKSSRQVAAVEYAPGPSRPRRSAAAGNALDVKKEGDGGMGSDEVAELWAQFAADHYEIVEQLPLELHRNSRLLRELDAESLCESRGAGRYRGRDQGGADTQLNKPDCRPRSEST